MSVGMDTTALITPNTTALTRPPLLGGNWGFFGDVLRLPDRSPAEEPAAAAAASAAAAAAVAELTERMALRGAAAETECA